MAKTDPFTLALKQDLEKRGLTLSGAADKIDKSFCQFRRELRGKTKLGIMSVDTVATLAQRGLISEGTVNMYWQQLREELRFKKEKAPVHEPERQAILTP